MLEGLHQSSQLVTIPQIAQATAVTIPQIAQATAVTIPQVAQATAVTIPQVAQAIAVTALMTAQTTLIAASKSSKSLCHTVQMERQHLCPATLKLPLAHSRKLSPLCNTPNMRKPARRRRLVACHSSLRLTIALMQKTLSSPSSNKSKFTTASGEIFTIHLISSQISSLRTEFTFKTSTLLPTYKT